MRVYVVQDEFYPVYYITEYENHEVVDLPEELIKKHKAAFVEFRETNSAIKNLLQEQRNDPL